MAQTMSVCMLLSFLVLQYGDEGMFKTLRKVQGQLAECRDMFADQEHEGNR